jgi:hypothetical protein
LKFSQSLILTWVVLVTCYGADGPHFCTCSKKKAAPKEGAQKGAAPGAAKAPIGKKLPAVPESVLLRRKRRDHDRLNKVKNALKVRCIHTLSVITRAYCLFPLAD